MESSGPVLRPTVSVPMARGRLPRWLLPATLGALAFLVLTTVVGMASGAPPDFLALDATISLVYLGTGVFAWIRRPEVLTGPLLVACAVFNCIGSFGPTARPVLTNLGFAFEAYYDVALAVLVLALPGRWPIGAGRWLSIAMLGAFLVRSASRLFLQDPSTVVPGFPPNPFAITTDLTAFLALETASNAVIALLALTIALDCVRRLVTSRPLVRRVMWPILAAGILAMGAAAFDAAEYAYGTATEQLLVDLPEPWAPVFSWSLYAARLFVPIGLLVGSLRSRRAGGPLIALAVELGRVPSPPRVQSALAAALGDPDVRIVRPDPDGSGWTDADGRPTEVPVEDSRHAVTMLEHGGRPLAAIVHDPVLREDPALVGSVAAVLRLAVENERLDGELAARLEEVRASRARLVVAAAEERRRVERDLHDGAQQRLVAVTLALQRARQVANASGATHELRDGLAAVADELQGAIDDLRELARGIHPALLEDEGLSAAVGALARRAGITVELQAELERRLPPDIESTAYFTVSEALTNAIRHARASHSTVTITDAGDRLMIVIEDDGVGGADPSRGSGLAGLSDRLAAADGHLVVESPIGGGTVIRAEIPL